MIQHNKACKSKKSTDRIEAFVIPPKSQVIPMGPTRFDENRIGGVPLLHGRHLPRPKLKAFISLFYVI